MRIRLAAPLLIVIVATLANSSVMATTAPPPAEPDADATPPAPIESQPVTPPPASRGQLLYENHCQTCHTSVVHVREDHRARSLQEVEQWVRRWADELKLTWRAEEINDVVDYLNQQYYKLELPAQ